jgi:hypothetical protein
MDLGRTSGQGALGWAVVTCVIAGLVGLIGYTVGASTHEDAAAEASRAPTPGLIPVTEAYVSGRSEGYRRGQLRAYREGRFDGLEEGRRAERRRLERTRERIRRDAAREALAGIEPGSWFLVAAAPNGRALGDRIRLSGGQRYRLCNGGSSVCSGAPTRRGR